MLTTEQHDGSKTDETLSTHPKLIHKENSRSEIWHYSAYKTDAKGELTLLHPYASVAINVFGEKATHQIFLSIYRLLILIFSEN